jgi:hypothetical protein
MRKVSSFLVSLRPATISALSPASPVGRSRELQPWSRPPRGVESLRALAAEMDRTGKVDGAYRRLKQKQDKEKRPASS